MADNPSLNSTNSSSRRSLFRNRNSSRSITPFSTTSSSNSKNGGGGGGSTATTQPQPTHSNASSINGDRQVTNSTNGSIGGGGGDSGLEKGGGTSGKLTATPMINSNSIGSTSTGSKKGNHLSLKRFFKKLKPGEKLKHALSSAVEPIDTSLDLFHRYGEVGKLLGAGASGSVNLLQCKKDPNKVYAVKKFRNRLPQEAQSDYEIKVKNEFKVGDYLKHQNIIYTFELIKDYSKISKQKLDPDYYIIMEYCPFDFFNLVMSGLMGTNEIFCYFKQMINGVGFLHENGLAHRDLKLDNCVVNQHGILRLIDFGSAVQFKKEVPQGYTPTSEEIMLDSTHKLSFARGIVGSDPYLSPEVFEPLGPGYDPRTADVWSIAIIYCCMILKRFPWKIPKISDPSYRSFAAPTLINDENTSLENELKVLSMSNGVEETSTTPPPKEENGEGASSNGNNRTQHHHHHHHHHNSGPERLLKLLPEPSRNVIKNMLILDPRKRFLMPDVLSDAFVQGIQVCLEQKDENGEVVVESPSNHSHHLVTEEDLKKLAAEREREKRLKDVGIA
ncbi:uncharacterized protein J8A68_003399 [[Candida] subhashii]|uniref:non-specific serine/threonine protein kinase n=1 Tax=[Candida] subhashii TaxID=561895 RepID=A0A8J5Q9A3_9ASCO|nr:uncharacterized protein J8A68_003399 [[Candida] subhashii]KAG7663089.1 hypothetical protein J8A68_003399 [[Candida] subhashii]